MKVLLIAMCDSVHTARWINQLNGSEFKIVLFPSTPHRRLHSAIAQIIRKPGSDLLRMRRLDRYSAFIFGLIDLLFAQRLQGWRLRRFLEREHFDLVHLLETQHAGYLFLRAMRKRPHSSPVALSVWGSDFAWFVRKPRHQLRIKQTLELISFLFVECQRDELLARGLGYLRQCSQPISASGGVGRVESLRELSSLERPSLRTAIIVKGYTGFVGEASTSIRAVVQNAKHLQGFKIHVYSCSIWMVIKLRLTRKWTGLEIHPYRKKSLTHEEVLTLFRESRVSLSLSLCDGFPGSFREAVWTGAFPIESIGSCVNEWASSENQVRLVDPHDFESVVNSLGESLTDPNMVDYAWQLNAELAARLSTELTVSRVLVEYRRALNSGSALKPQDGLSL